MKITKTPKRKPETPADLAALSARIVEEPESSLASCLHSIHQWTWPRGDLYAWIAVLNRFDDILERICHNTPLLPVQTAPFAPHDRDLLVAMLGFTRLLLENCMNRKLYASYEHLNILLGTDDADVLEQLLYLVLRPAQQHSSTGRHELPLNQQRLRILAAAWPPRDAGMEFSDVARIDPPIPATLSSVHVQGYRRAGRSSASSTTQATTSSNIPTSSSSQPSTPAKLPASSSTSAPVSAPTTASPDEGIRRAVISGLDSTSRTPGDLVQTCDAWDDLSDDDQFELFHKVRIALACHDTSQRRQALVCRLLAIACFVHAAPESFTNTHLFMVEPGIVLRTAALLEPPHTVDDKLRGAALYALDSFRHFRNRLGDVLTAVNASISHGILRQLLHCTIQRLRELAKAESSPPSFDVFVDALMTLIANLATVASGTSMATGAGLVPQMLELACIEAPTNYLVQRTSTRAVGLLDSILYAYPSTFQQFTASHGIDVLVRRVESDMSLEQGPEPLPYGRVHVLRQILRLFHHMMTTSGTADALRNLIDTPLVPALRFIMVHKQRFGVHVLAQAISIMATFVHNEPTQLATIQENKLPEAFVRALQDDMEPSFELLTALTPAISALGLNEAGLRLLMESRIVPRIVHVLDDPRYHRVLLDRDNANVFGSSIDELVRHHPSLKEGVLSELIAVVDNIVAQAHAYSPPANPEARCLYVVDEPLHLAARPIRTSHVVLDDPDHTVPEAVPGDDNVPLAAFDVMCRFLEGLFRNVAPCRDFLRCDGLSRLLAFFSSPCVAYNFPASAPADSCVMLLRAMTEESPSTVLSLLLREVKRSLDELAQLPTDSQPITPVQFRALVRLHTRIQLLSDVCQTFGQSFAFTQSGTKIPLAFLRVLREGGDVATITQLTELFRHAAWDHLHVKASLQDADCSPAMKALQYMSVRIPASILSMLSVITRLFMPRRYADPEFAEAAKNVSNDMGTVLRTWSSLRSDVPESDALAEHTYLHFVLRHLFYDKRTTHGEQAHTLILRAWCEQGGDAALVDQVRRISTHFVQGELDNDETSVISHAAGALRSYLDLVLRFVPARTLLDASQTAQLSRDPSFSAHALLVQLRRHALDILAQLWDAPWLPKLPLTPVREVAQSLGMVLYADREDPPPPRPNPPSIVAGASGLPSNLPSALAATLSSASLPVRRPSAAAVSSVDEGRLAQLVEMGFPRGSARRALERCHNNISAATEYILQHPELEDEPDDVPEQLPFPEPDQIANALAGALRAQVSSMDGGQQQPDGHALEHTEDGEQRLSDGHHDSDAPHVSVDAPARRNDTPSVDTDQLTTAGSTQQPTASTPSPNRVALDQGRERMRPNFFLRLLELADTHEPLVFDARHVFVFFSREQEQVDRLWNMVVQRLSFDMTNPVMTVRLHLLALLLTSDRIQPKLPWPTLPHIARNLVTAMEQAPPHKDETETVWLSSALLSLCGILSASEWSEGYAAVPGDATERTAFLDEMRPMLLTLMLRILEHSSQLSDGSLLGVARMLVLLTRDPRTAASMVEQRALPLVLRPLLTRRRFQRASYQRLVIIVLRHMVESGGSLLPLLTNELHVWMNQSSRPRPTEVSSLLKAMGHSVIRSPPTFLDAAASQLELIEFHSMKSPTNLRPRQGAQVPDEPASAQAMYDAVVHMLMNDLVSVREGTTNAPEADADSLISVSDARDTYVFALLQCLVELLSSYMGCKQSFLQYRVHGTTPVLAYFMNELVPIGFLAQYEAEELRKRMTESNWAISVLVALATDPLPLPDATSVPDMLVSIRKALLDALYKALREATQTDGQLEIKFGRLYALSDTCHRLLTARPNTDTTAPKRMEVVLHMAKTMLEKNFVAVLTQALADLDVNMPSLSSLLDSVLRPLEHLTKASIKMARSDRRGSHDKKNCPWCTSNNPCSVARSERGDDGEDHGNHHHDHLETTHTTDDADDDVDEDMPDGSYEDEDEAPDFYRNSSLGMHTGEMEQGGYDSEQLTDDLEDEDADMEMTEYSSEDESELSTDAEGLDGDSAHVVEVMEEDDDDDDSDDDDDEEDDNVVVDEHELEDDMDNSQDDDRVGMDDDDEPSGSNGNVHSDHTLSDDMIDGDEDFIDDEDLDDDELDVQDFDYVLDEGMDDDDEGGGVNEILEALDDMEDPADGEVFDPEHAGDSGDEAIYETDDLHPLNMTEELAWHPRMENDRFGANWSWTQANGRHGRRSARQGPPTFFSVPASSTAAQNGGASSSTSGERAPPSHRSVPSVLQDQDAMFHPLLVDDNTLDRDRETPGWQRSMEALMGENTMQFLEMFLQQNVPHGADASIRIELDQGRGMPRMQITNLVSGGGNASDAPTSMLRAPHPSSSSEPESALPAYDATSESLRFIPLSTIARRGEEAQLILGTTTADLNSLFRAPLIERLLPAYHARREREREEKQQKAAAATTAAASTSTSASATAADDSTVSRQNSESKRKHHDMENEPEPNHSHNGRITVSINGETVDLTDTGIDPTFLEALPDELREEALLSQQLSSRMARPSRQIVPDFLDVLPRSLRAELQHVDESSLPFSPSHGSGSAHVSPTSDAHNLPSDSGPLPHRTQAQDLAQDESQAPSQASSQPPSQSHHQQVPPPSQTRESASQGRDAIQLLDRTGLASLVRLLFLPSMNTRSSLLFKILAHLSENARTRYELLGMLLMVLWDSMYSAASVDRAFTAMCSKAAAAKQTPQRSTPRRGHAGMSSSGILPPSTPATPMPLPLTWMGDEAPHLIASRSLEMLTYLTQVNNQAALYFLREDRAKKGSKRIPIQVLLGLLEKEAMLEHAPLLNALLALLHAVTKPLSTAHPASDGHLVLDKAYGEMDVPSMAADRLASIVQPLHTPISSRGFQHTLAVASHLSHLPGAHEALSVALQQAAKRASDSLLGDLDALITSLPEPAIEPGSTEVGEHLVSDATGVIHTTTQAHAVSESDMNVDERMPESHSESSVSLSLPLAKLASPSSAQAEFLRCLRALDYLYVGK